VLAKLPARELRAAFVWLPVLPADDLAAARGSAARYPDPRITHFWDGERALGWALGRTLALPPRAAGHDNGLAWDAYLLYARGVRWKPAAPPPAPSFWMHQLYDAAKLAPHLDAAVLRERTEGLLAPAPTRAAPR